MRLSISRAVLGRCIKKRGVAQGPPDNGQLAGMHTFVPTGGAKDTGKIRKKGRAARRRRLAKLLLGEIRQRLQQGRSSLSHVGQYLLSWRVVARVAGRLAAGAELLLILRLQAIPLRGNHLQKKVVAGAQMSSKPQRMVGLRVDLMDPLLGGPKVSQQLLAKGPSVDQRIVEVSFQIHRVSRRHIQGSRSAFAGSA